MFVVDRNKELVGYSVWPWDSLYAPLIGCFVEGRLEQVAPCNRERQQVRLDGPLGRVWFRMRVSADTRAAIDAGDRGVVLLRLEDGEPVRPVAEASPRFVRGLRVEELVAGVSHRSRAALDGFPAFVAAPAEHQIHVLFLDILGRPPEPSAVRNYLDQMEHGKSILAVREDVLASAEFRDRIVTVSNRLGSLITSRMWKSFADAPLLGRRPAPLRKIRLADYAEMSDLDFATQIHRDCHGDEPSEGSRNALAGWASEHGRTFVATLLLRDAANGGLFLGLIE